MRATSLRGKKRRDAEQDKIKQLLKNCGRQFLDTLETLASDAKKCPQSGETAETPQRAGYVRIVGHLNPRCWLMKLLIDSCELENLESDSKMMNIGNAG